MMTAIDTSALTQDGDTLELPAQWFSVYCQPISEWNRETAQLEHVGGGCGYIGRNDRRSSSPVMLTKQEAQKIAARHRKQHRSEP